MAESEGSSQKKRQGGFGLFKPAKSSRRSRRRPDASPTALPPNSQLTAQTSYSSSALDLPDFRNNGSRPIASVGAANPRKKRSNPFSWLFGQRSDRRSQRTKARSGNSSQVGQLPPRLSSERDSRLGKRSAADSRRANRANPPTLPTLADPAQNSGKTLVPFPPQTTQAALNARRRRRSPKTQLQMADQTLMQQPTALQQTTSLQAADTFPEDRSLGQGRRTEGRVLTRRRSRSTAIALYVARMVILSIGVGVLAGTVLSAWNPGNTLFLADVSNRPVKQVESPSPQAQSPHAAMAQIALTSEITPLKAKLQALVQQSPGFTPGLFLIDLDNYNYVNLSGESAFPSASMIKVPILIAFFQDVDAGKIRLDEKLTLTKELIAQGSGDMQSMPTGSQFTALETATQMIIASDNTATNMVIARLGGIAALNERFKSWGLMATSLKNVLPDLEGTNVTSPRELTNLMVRVSQGELVSMRSRDRMLSIMQRTVNNSQLPQGLGEGATIAHKTGDIGTLIGDVGLVDMPNGKRYATAVMVKRAFNDDRAYDLVQKMSSTIYQHLNSLSKVGRPNSPLPTPTTSASPNSADQGAETDTQRMQDEGQQTPNDAQHIPDSELNPGDSPPQETGPDRASYQ